MRVLCLSDLHFKVLDRDIAAKRLPMLALDVRKVVLETRPDLIVLTGDTLHPMALRSLSALCSLLFPASLPVLVTLGNHEFWGRRFEETLEALHDQLLPADNVHFLDICGSFLYGGYNFVGGTLFYDGSLRYRQSQAITPWNGWNDHFVVDLVRRYREINQYFVEHIKRAMIPGMATVLCTHHVPHQAFLGGFPPNHYNFYSGMRDLPSELPFASGKTNGLICGHTHYRMIGELVPGFMCVNVGSDYGILRHYLLELP